MSTTPTDPTRPATEATPDAGQDAPVPQDAPAPATEAERVDAPAAGTSHSRTSTTPEREPSALTLAAMAAVAVPGLDPARLALPQEASASLRTVGVIDSRGRHWEVLQARSDAAGASLDAEAEVLRRIARSHDDGLISFDVSRPAGSLRREGLHVQVRSHIEGKPISIASLRPGPGLSAGLGRALGELHELSTTVVSEAGLPVYDADEVRTSWLTLLDDVAATGKVPASLLSRWEQVLDDTALWRFRPTVVHGDLAEENVLTAGGGVVALQGLSQIHVGDPAEDLAWIYSTAPVDCLDSIEAAYDLARTEGVDKHLRDRAELVSEMSLAKWLLHGVRSQDQEIIDDAVSMLADLLDQVGDEPLVEPHEPRLAPVPGTRTSAGPDEATSEITMVERQADHSGTDAEVTGDAAVSARTDLAADQTPTTDLAAVVPLSAQERAQD
ncbi:MAG: phosphotransferase [Actinomyces urogenitalis]|uniref:phosphotransferase n=1 Tax=Actinomyces urogenitalis TaxID=103621 RepID=UPI0024312101|nr:phosphotransferase [Actinomyces urogenitalis]MCI7456025.1 phosphotransferase [Actinomyces urogenitalis]MDY3678387.1 phosphotransferase [Actinomyces urogenitalis]